MKLFIFLTLFCTTFLFGAPESERVYSTCELLADPQQFNHKIVSVRGDVQAGLEGSWVEDSECKEPFLVGGLSLPKAISLSYRTESGDEPPRNSSHIKQVTEEINKISKGTKAVKLVVTYKGLFETREKWVTLVLPSGDKQLWGLGHLNGFPAQLVIIDMSDPVTSKAKR
jgi:hypothetical protein